MRTDLSEEHVATSGRYGCGAVSHARESEGGVSGESSVRVPGREIGGGIAAITGEIGTTAMEV